MCPALDTDMFPSLEKSLSYRRPVYKEYAHAHQQENLESELTVLFFEQNALFLHFLPNEAKEPFYHRSEPPPHTLRLQLWTHTTMHLINYP